MRSPSRRSVLAAGGGIVAGLAGGYAARPYLDADKPVEPVALSWAPTEWPFPDYDPARTRNPPSESAPDSDLAEDWRTDAVREDEHTPLVVANGRVFAATWDTGGGTVHALDVTDAGTAWRHRFPTPAGTAPAVCAPGDSVYYRVDQYENGPLGAFGAATGDQVWGVDDPPLGGWTVGAGRLYYGSRVSGSLHAYHARSGDRLWKTTVDDDRLVVQSFHPEFGVFATSLGTLYALDPEDGSVRWTDGIPAHVKSGPVVAGGTAVVSKWTEGMDLLAFDAESGDDLWQYQLSPTEVQIDDGIARRWYEVEAATTDIVLVRERRADDSASRIHAVDAESGDRLWRIAPPDGSRRFSPPTVVGDTVYVCVGDDRTELLRLRLDDGTVTDTWSLPAGPVGRGPVVTDGRVLVQTRGPLLAFR
jgi:outer membrane protein assembly factor BamB